jgi:hypothetical protein
MPHSFVRIALVAPILAFTAPLSAQTPSATSGSVGFGVALGTAIPSGYALNMPGDMGPNVQLTAMSRRSAKLAFRADARAQMLSGASVIPSCVPGTQCRGYALHPDQVYSLTTAAELRPFDATPRLLAVLGGGMYHARGPQATSFGTTFGTLGGVGIDLGRSGHGFVIEAQYHYLPNALGVLTGLLVPSVGYRF